MLDGNTLPDVKYLVFIDTKCFLLVKNVADHHLGPVAPSTVDGVQLKQPPHENKTILLFSTQSQAVC